MRDIRELKETVLYKTHHDGSTTCGVCERKCRINNGERGFCGSRMNFNGCLYSLTYGSLTSVTFNPIEKKPLFHYWVGSKALSAGSWGCNLRCVYCQNYTLSMKDGIPKNSIYISPEDFIDLALRKRSEGMSFTFNETSCTLLEYIMDCFKLAAQEGLYRNLNTNGYMTSESLDLLIDAGLDSLCIDVKGSKTFYEQLCNNAEPDHVWRNAAYAKKKGIHVELVNLVIPGANDGRDCIEDIINRTKGEIGEDTPLHFTKFYPAFEAQKFGLVHSTPIRTLETARNNALDKGLEYVYLGNVPGHIGENTYCPSCKLLLIKRYGFSIQKYHLNKEDCCPECGTKILIVGKSKF